MATRSHPATVQAKGCVIFEPNYLARLLAPGIAQIAALSSSEASTTQSLEVVAERRRLTAQPCPAGYIRESGVCQPVKTSKSQRQAQKLPLLLLPAFVQMQAIGNGMNIVSALRNARVSKPRRGHIPSSCTIGLRTASPTWRRWAVNQTRRRERTWREYCLCRALALVRAGATPKPPFHARDGPLRV